MAEYIEGRRAIEEALRAGVPIRRILVQDSLVAETARGRSQDKGPVKGLDKSQGKSQGKDSGRAQGRGAGRAQELQGRSGKGPGRAPRHCVRGQAAEEQQDPGLDGLLHKIRRRVPEVKTERVGRARLDALSSRGASHGAHQGIAAEVPPYRYADITDIAREAGSRENALVLVLDHITDEGNFGAILRSAEIVGAAGVVIPAKRSVSVGVGVYKTSAGAALHLPIARVPNIAAALQTLKQAGCWVAGASEKTPGSVWDAPFYGRIALVMGSEGSGISPLVLQRCDFLVSLPQVGQLGSLNVSSAACALCYEWLRQSTHRSEAGTGVRAVAKPGTGAGTEAGSTAGSRAPGKRG